MTLFAGITPLRTVCDNTLRAEFVLAYCLRRDAYSEDERDQLAIEYKIRNLALPKIIVFQDTNEWVVAELRDLSTYTPCSEFLSSQEAWDEARRLENEDHPPSGSG